MVYEYDTATNTFLSVTVIENLESWKRSCPTDVLVTGEWLVDGDFGYAAITPVHNCDECDIEQGGKYSEAYNELKTFIQNNEA